jgi:hypothetical protein
LHDFPSSQSPEAFQHPANRKLKCRSCSRVFKSQNKFRYFNFALVLLTITILILNS